MVKNNIKQIANILQNPFLKSGLVDVQRVSINVQSLKAVEQAIEGVTQ
jgi:hypothetical protein